LIDFFSEFLFLEKSLIKKNHFHHLSSSVKLDRI